MAPAERDPFVDFVRAMSLLVVVAWHWVFTILIWEDDGPHVTNPIGFTSGMFIVTWVFQVMPLFFFVGGYAHTVSWDRARNKGNRMRAFVWGRVKQLLVPALSLVVTWVVIGSVLIYLTGGDWVVRTVILVLSPLWFLATYLLLVLLFPVARWFHLRFGPVALIWLAGGAVIVDVARFTHGHSRLAWLNMILVWGFCHQLGFFYKQLVALGRQGALMLASFGGFVLIGLVYSDLYPGSMVGVPGDRFSNMAPPTICIIGLVCLQAGLALLVRPWVLDKLETSRRWRNTSETINRFSMPLYLYHATGMAIAKGLWYQFGFAVEYTEPTLRWWLLRPIAFIGPLFWTLPVILLFGHKWIKEQGGVKEIIKTSTGKDA
jgi:hypothetical protein